MKLLTPAVCTLLVGLACVGSSMTPQISAAEAGLLSISPLEPSAAPSSILTVQVTQHADIATKAAQVNITFDRSKLQVVSIATGSPYAGSTLVAGTYPETVQDAIADANSTTGEVQNIGAYFLPGTSNVVPPGDNVFLVVTLQTIAAGVSPVTLSRAEMIDGTGLELSPVTTSGGYVGIAHASGDADADGVLDTVDNCPADQNPSQRNDDANFVDMTPPLTADDKTWPNSDVAGNACDTDDDNDGISDADEVNSGTGCAAVTDPLLRDTDGDRFLDGAECTLGTNPTLASSKPLLTACGPTGDADGDRIGDRIEVCHYGTDPANNDTDGDKSTTGARDGCEVASFNGDRIVNVADQGILASFVGGTYPYHVGADINKDGNLNPADQGILASLISPTGQCP